MARNKIILGNNGSVKVYDKIYKPIIEIFYPDEDNYLIYGYNGGMIKYTNYDSEFIGYSHLHWSGYNGGSVTIVNQQLTVNKGAVLSGEEALRTIYVGSKYVIDVLVTQLTSGQINIYYGNEKIFIGSINSTGQRQLQFIATTETTTIILEHSSGGNFKIDNFYLSQIDEAELITPGDFELGSNEEDDYFFQPSKYNLIVKLKSGNLQRYKSLLSELQSAKSVLQLNDENYIRLYKGIITETESNFIKQEISAKTKNIRSINVFKEYEKGDPPLYSETYLNDFFKKLNPSDYYNEVVWISDWKVKTDSGTFSIKECKMSWKNLYATSVPFTTKKEIVKAVLNNLASYLIEGIEDNKLYVMPIFYNGNSLLYQITNQVILELKIETRISPLRVQSYDGRKIEYSVHNGGGEYIEHPVLSNDGGEPIKDIGLNLTFPFPCNGEDEFDNKGYSSSLFDPDYPIITNSASYLKDINIYSNEDSFVNHALSLTEKQNKLNRNILKLKVKGCNYEPYWFYQLNSSAEQIYRVIKLKRMRSKNITEINLIECLKVT